MDRDIFRCQKIQKVVSGVVLCMDSYYLHATRFFDQNELMSLFYSLVLVVSLSGYGRFFRGFEGGPAISHLPAIPYITVQKHGFNLPVRNISERLIQSFGENATK
jgi:hypothetical protein